MSVDSFKSVIHYEAVISIQYNFIPQYDYIISVYPVNKTFKIQHIGIGHNKDSGNPENHCLSSCKYSINDSDIVIPMNIYDDYPTITSSFIGISY